MSLYSEKTSYLGFHVLIFLKENQFYDSILPVYKLCVFFTEIDMLSKSLTVSQRNKVCLEEEMKNLKLLSDAAILRSQQIHISRQQEVNLQARCYDLQKEVLGKENSFLVLLSTSQP